MLGLAGCPTGAPTRTPEDFGAPTEGDEPVPLSGKPKHDDHANDAPEISRSRGTRGGVVVLWPRVWPKGKDEAATAELAGKVQKRLEALARRAAGSRTIEVRPAPERACPKEGCEATSVSAVVVVRDKACALVAVVGGPGVSPSRILPWAGKVELTPDTVPFREPPEEQVKVVDHVPCATMLDGLEDADSAITRYIVGLMPGG